MRLSVCKTYFLLFLYLAVNTFLLGLYFLILDLTIFIEFNILSLNSVSILMTILLDWMSLLFMSFVLFISSMVINYSEEYTGWPFENETEPFLGTPGNLRKIARTRRFLILGGNIFFAFSPPENQTPSGGGYYSQNFKWNGGSSDTLF